MRVPLLCIFGHAMHGMGSSDPDATRAATSGEGERGTRIERICKIGCSQPEVCFFLLQSAPPLTSDAEFMFRVPRRVASRCCGPASVSLLSCVPNGASSSRARPGRGTSGRATK